MGKSRKGGQYEREICRQLGRWWSHGERDDIFWRTSNSGGRATTRSKTGRRTFGQYGDVQAVDPVGAPLLRAFCFEVKRGYSSSSFADVLDQPRLAAQQEWEKFVEQARTAARDSRAKYWLLIQRRDLCRAFIFFPHALYLELQDNGVLAHQWGHPFVLVRTWVKSKTDKGTVEKICGTTLDNFLQVVGPEQVKALDVG